MTTSPLISSFTRIPFVRSSIFLGILVLLHTAGFAQTIITQPQAINLPGSTDFDGWSNDGLINSANPGYPSFPGAAPWPAPIGSNVSGSGDAVLNKTAGNAYPSGASIYFGSFTLIANDYGGTLAVSDTTPLSNVQTLILQLQIGQSLGFDLVDNAPPVLNYNSGTQALAPSYSAIWGSEQIGTFTPPPPDDGVQPLFANLRAFQWDLTGLGVITTFNITFDAVEHSQLYALQLDQGTVMAVVVPEPATLSLVGAAAVAIAMISRRRQKLRSR